MTENEKQLLLFAPYDVDTMEGSLVIRDESGTIYLVENISGKTVVTISHVDQMDNDVEHQIVLGGEEIVQSIKCYEAPSK